MIFETRPIIKRMPRSEQGKVDEKLSCSWLCMCPQIWLVSGNLWLCLPVVGERLYLAWHTHRDSAATEKAVQLKSAYN